jgi:hypothetical protein
MACCLLQNQTAGSSVGITICRKAVNGCSANEVFTVYANMAYFVVGLSVVNCECLLKY